MLESYLKWFKAHERLLLVLTVLASVCWLGNHYINASADQAKLKADALIAQLQADKQTVAQITSQSFQAQQQYQAALDAVSKQNIALAQAVASDNALLKKQQTVDTSLTLPELANRWAALVPLSPGDLTPINNGLQITDSAAHSTVEELENVPVLKDEVAKQQQVIDNNIITSTKANDLIVDLNSQVSALNMQIGDSDKACKAEIASVKAQNRKSKLRFFKWGYVSGFVSGLFVGHAAGF